jgi:AsmA protein
MKVLKFAGAAIAAVIIIVALLLVIGIPSNFLMSAVQDRVERQTGYRLTIAGATRIGLWPSLNVTLNDLTLADPKDHETSDRITVGRIQADVPLASLWSGHPKITELAIVRPVLNVPLLRQRTGQPASTPKAPTSNSDADTDALVIDHVTVTDGTVMFSNQRDHIDSRIGGINADARMGADRKVTITGSASAGERPLKYEIKATAPGFPIDRQNIPLDLTLDAPGFLQAPLAAKAEVRLNGTVVMINGLTGTLGDGAFSGWASVDLTSKPLLKLDVDFQQLDIVKPAGSAASAAPGSQQPWSNAPIEVSGLNYVDAEVRVSAAELHIGDTRLAPAAVDVAIGGGVLKATFANLGVYEGQASGEVVVDASAANAAYTLRGDLVGIRALPLFKRAADFDKLEGKMQAKIAVQSAGASQQAIMSGLSGTVFAIFQDGAIRDLNIAQMIRSLTAGTLSGWQETSNQSTDLTQLSASFRLNNGQATTTDLNLVGPLVRVTGAGTVGLGTKTMAFRVEPKLVMTTQGQGRATDPVGLGIPVVIDGPWSQPRIYPEMAGILDNPDAAYAKLKDMGKGLFGKDLFGKDLFGAGGVTGPAGAGGGTTGVDGGADAPPDLGKLLGTLMQGFGVTRDVKAPAAPPAPASPTPDPATPALPAPAQNAQAPEPAKDSQPMNDVLKQLFNR